MSIDLGYIREIKKKNDVGRTSTTPKFMQYCSSCYGIIYIVTIYMRDNLPVK